MTSPTARLRYYTVRFYGSRLGIKLYRIYNESFYFVPTFFCFQKNHATVIMVLMPTAIHRPPLNPASDFVK